MAEAVTAAEFVAQGSVQTVARRHARRATLPSPELTSGQSSQLEQQAEHMQQAEEQPEQQAEWEPEQ